MRGRGLFGGSTASSRAPCRGGAWQRPGRLRPVPRRTSCHRRVLHLPAHPAARTLWRALRRSLCPPGAPSARPRTSSWPGLPPATGTATSPPMPRAGLHWRWPGSRLRRRVPIPGWVRYGPHLAARRGDLRPGRLWMGPHCRRTSKYYFQVIFERTDAAGASATAPRTLAPRSPPRSPARTSLLRIQRGWFRAATSSIQLIFPGPTDGWDSYAGWGRNKAVVYASFTPSAGADPRQQLCGAGTPTTALVPAPGPEPC